MKNTQLPEPLLKVAREEDPARDPAWKALLEGPISEAEMAALEARAQASPREREIFDAYRPLDQAVRDRILAEVFVPPSPPPRSRWMRVSKAITSVATLAVVIALLWPPRPFKGEWAIRVVAEQDQRGEPVKGQLPHLGPGSRLEIGLTPASKIDGPVEARAFLVRDGRARPWDVRIELVDGGAARIVGTKEELFPGVAPGRWEMLVVFGHPGKLPDAETVSTLTQEGRRAESRSYRLVGQEIELRDVRDP